MKLLSLFAILLSLAISLAGQSPSPAGPPFDIQEFTKKFEVVEWLVEYDNVAWKTTDVVMEQPKTELERLGQEWFCFQDKDKVWHAVYGKLAAEKFDAVFHFEMDSAQKITKSTKSLDQDFLTKHATALKTGRTKLNATIPEGSPRFNQYIRQNADKTFSVWLLPAFQTNRMAVFGGEAIYTIDASGSKILKDESYFQKEGFRGFMSEPPREIWLKYTEQEKPSLGAIFFVWYYKPYFTKIFIDNAKTRSTVINAAGNSMWVHVEKDSTPKPNEEGEPKPKLERKKPGDK